MKLGGAAGPVGPDPGIGFRRVRVTFEAGPDEETRVAVVDTRAGEQVRVAIEDDKPLFGRTSYGNYRIEVRDVRSIAF